MKALPSAFALRVTANRSCRILPCCPHVAFCGCGASVEVFGRSVRTLWRAAAWLKFPPAAPAPGMAAVRAHHVMIIRQYLGDDRALVYNANSGGHLTRVHVVSLRGYRHPQSARGVTHGKHLRSDAGQLVAGAAIHAAIRSGPAGYVAFGAVGLDARSLIAAARLADDLGGFRRRFERLGLGPRDAAGTRGPK